MADRATERCVGCGAAVPRIAGPIHRYMTSAPGCWALWGELNARLLSDPQTAAYRHLCVDSYAVQHPGSPGPQAIQSVAGHLVSLYAQLELGFPSDRMPRVVESMLRTKGRFRWLTPPAFDDAHTVASVLKSQRDLRVEATAWATSVWRAWSAHHRQVRHWYEVASRQSVGSA
jgi:Family of unknown function (DUF5946)